MQKKKSLSKPQQDPIDRLVIWGCNLLHLTKYTDFFRQLAKFVITGFTTTGVNWLIYFPLVIVGLQYNISIFIGWAISTAVSFWISSKWVFNTTKNKTQKRLVIEFFIGAACALGLSQFFNTLFIERYEFSKFWAMFWTTAITMVFNYVTRKIFMEDHKKKH